MDSTTVLLMILILVSITLVAFFSSSEASLISVNKIRIRHMAEQEGNPGAQSVNRVVHRHEKFFATILLTENVFIILSSVLAERLASSLLNDSGYSVLIATVVMTVLIVMFGEITPKTLAAQHAVSWSVRVARIIEFIMMLETAVIYVFTLLPRALSRLTGGDSALHAQTVTEAELRMLIDISEAEGAVEPQEAELMQKAFRLGDLSADAIMTPRTDIVWVRQGATFAEFLQTYAQETHSRFPVYAGEVENALGILHTKDVLKAFAEGKLAEGDQVTPLMRPAYFYPESKPVDDLFVEMRTEGAQTVMLVDEHGGIAGLLTLKQLVGEVVGSIVEKEGVGPAVETIDERTLQVDAGMWVEEANERLGLGLPDGNYDTLAGFVLAVLGHIPREGEQLRYDSLRLVVTEMKGVKIERILVTRG